MLYRQSRNKLSTKAASLSDQILATETEYFYSNRLCQLILIETRRKKEFIFGNERILAISADVWLFLISPQIYFVFLNEVDSDCLIDSNQNTFSQYM